MKHGLLLIAILGLVLLFDPFNVVHGEASHGSAPAKAASAVFSPTLGTASAAAAERRTSQLVCTLSAFFSADAEQAFRPRAQFEGRGLINCRNDQGFTTEMPVLADLEVQLPPQARRLGTEVTLSSNSSAFVVPREINEIQDSFVVRPSLQPVADVSSQGGNGLVLLRGLRHDLIIEMKLNSQTIQLEGVKVTGLRLRIDDAAPDLY